MVVMQMHKDSSVSLNMESRPFPSVRLFILFEVEDKFFESKRSLYHRGFGKVLKGTGIPL